VKNEMINAEPAPTADGVLNKIEEAAYYSWLNRGRYAQAGDELNDWIEAEKEVQNKLQNTQTRSLEIVEPLHSKITKINQH
jgi:hypothetical protein